MKKILLHEIIIALLALLIVYAGSSKLLDMAGFRAGMREQPFPAWLNGLLAMVLPFAEIIIAAALGFTKTRRVALYAYTALMICFAGYTGLVVTGFFARTPCGCGGIISGLSWGWHFIINLIFLLLSSLALWHNRHNHIMHDQGVSRKPVTE